MALASYLDSFILQVTIRFATILKYLFLIYWDQLYLAVGTGRKFETWDYRRLSACEEVKEDVARTYCYFSWNFVI